MTNREALEKLKELSTHLESVEYGEIVEIFRTCIQKIPIPVARMPKNTAIDRARKNQGEVLFEKVQDLSYITDKEILEKYVVDFGRANKPHQAMFYGAIETSQISAQRITALAETSNLLQDPTAINIEGELYTISRWENNELLLLAEVVFSEAALNANPDIRNNFEAQTKLAKREGFEDIEFYTAFLKFISDEFAREIKTHHDYKISNAYTELVLSKGNIHGIAYPSVKTKYMGVNVVFPPLIIDKYFTIKVASTQKVHRKLMKVLITNHKNCLNPSENPENIVWTDLAREHKTSDEEIRNYFL